MITPHFKFKLIAMKMTTDTGKNAPNISKFLLVIFFSISASFLHSSFSYSQINEKKLSPVSPLTWSDKNELKRKNKTIDDLGKRYFGTGLRGTTADIDLLQRIADRKIIKKTDTQTLQATGVALGNIFKNELGLEWVVYQDKYGRSRALCVPDTDHCLFPTTMLSRRLEIGATVNVFETYQNALKLIDPYIPDTNAYDGKKPDPTPKASWTDNRKEKSNRIPIR